MRGLSLLLLALISGPGIFFSAALAEVSGTPATPPDTTHRLAGTDTARTGPGVPLPSTAPYFRLVVRRHPALYRGSAAFRLDAPRLQLTHPAQFQPLARFAAPSRFQSGVLGADMGAFAGIALGFLGMETGLWEEPTAWYLMGAGAALGAIWGGTLGSENASIRIRVEPDR